MELAFSSENKVPAKNGDRCRERAPRDPDRDLRWKASRIHDIIMGTADIPLI
jgi:hypothetical protein